MIENPLDILEQFPVRKSRKQKQAFRQSVLGYARRQGYDAREEKGALGARNVIIGDPAKAKYLLTAHYDTCAWLPFPNFITPCNFFIYLLYQLAIVAGMLAAVFGVELLVALAAPGWAALAGTLAWLVLFILLLAGPANRHNANDNTSGVVAVLEMARSMPEKLREEVCFVLFDLEEAGLFGSAGYQSRHRAQTKNQLVLNLDCVGDGDHLRLFPGKKVRKDPAYMARLQACEADMKAKTLRVVKKGGFYPSDQANFPYGVGVCALKRKWGTLYMDRIHTHRDVHLDMTNVNILRAAIISCLACERKGTQL